MIATMISPLTTSEMLLRVGAALVAGLLVGLEREHHGRAAGLRTTMLTCVAAALAMILSEVLFEQTAAVSNGWRPDPARLGAGILTGIGFLGAGTIMRHDNAIRGVTTAASLWFVTVLGLAFGTGQFLLGFVGLGVAMVTLLALPALEKHLQSDWYATLTLLLELDALRDDQIRERIESLGVKVKSMQLDYDLVKKQKTVLCQLKLGKPALFESSGRIVSTLAQWPGVLQVKWV